MTSADEIFLPFDILTYRWSQNIHVKSMGTRQNILALDTLILIILPFTGRVGCVQHWNQVHYPIYKQECENFGHYALDPQGNYLDPLVYTPHFKDANRFDTAQLNHYWSTNLPQFVKKSHRGNVKL
jgi:hypothetical protein